MIASRTPQDIYKDLGTAVVSESPPNPANATNALQTLVSSAITLTAGLAAASANSTLINAALNAARLAGGGVVTVVGAGVCYHDRTLQPGSYTKFVTISCVLRLLPGSSCNQVRNYGAQNSINRLNFISVSAGFMTVIEKGHNREVGDRVYIEGCQGNATPNGLKTITESGTDGSGFRYWKVAVASNAAVTNDIYTSVFVSNYVPVSGSAFSRTAASAIATVTIAAPGVVTIAAHGRSRNDPVYFTTTGALPTGLVANTVYYVAAILSSSTFTLSTVKRGTAITTTGSQSGVHTMFAQGTVVVTEPNHRKQSGDSIYVAGVPVVGNSFNGSFIILAVIKGVSWSYKQLGGTEVGTGTANTQTDTAMNWDIANLDYDSANNIFDELWAVNATIGNAANSEFIFHQLVDGLSRAVHIFNGGRAMRIPKMISTSQSGSNSKGTLQIESYAGDIEIGYCEQNGSTDDCLAWGLTNQTNPAGATASPSGLVDMGSLHAGKCFVTVGGNGAVLKIFTFVDYYDLGIIKVDSVDGVAAGVIIQDTSPSLSGTIQSIHIGSYTSLPFFGADSMIVVGWRRIESLRIDAMVEQQQYSGKALAKFGAGLTIGHLHIGTLSLQQNRATEIGFQFDAGCVIENFSIDSLRVTCQSGYEAFRVNSTAVLQNVNLSKTRYVCSTIAAGDLFSCNGGGTIQNLNISDFRGNGRGVYSASGSATPIKMKVSNVECPTLANDNGTGQSGTILFNGLDQAGLSLSMFYLTGSGTWKIKGKNFVHTPGFVATLSGTVSASIDCPDAQIDMGVNATTPPARLIPLAGNQLWNTNATGPGLYGYNAVGAWVKLF